MERNQLPVAVFDSGLGGISVLREIVRLLPAEDCIYYGDSRHAPYGVKSADEVLTLCGGVVTELLARGIKALVIACNTATSAAAQQLRERYPELPIIGIEPALKPAAERYPNGRILVMATPMTLAEEKFARLRAQFAADAEVIPVPCQGLMEYVEQGILSGPQLHDYLTGRLAPHLKQPVDAIVLGCTHYPFLAGAIRAVVGSGPEILDGSYGVAAQLRRRLDETSLRNPRTERGSVEFCNSLDDPELLRRCRTLFACRTTDDEKENAL